MYIAGKDFNLWVVSPLSLSRDNGNYTEPVKYLVGL